MLQILLQILYIFLVFWVFFMSIFFYHPVFSLSEFFPFVSIFPSSPYLLPPNFPSPSPSTFSQSSPLFPSARYSLHWSFSQPWPWVLTLLRVSWAWAERETTTTTTMRERPSSTCQSSTQSTITPSPAHMAEDSRSWGAAVEDTAWWEVSDGGRERGEWDTGEVDG